MRAKLPETEGFAERNGNRIHYEVYGQGPQTMVFLPPWSIVHSRIYKAQIPYFSERFRCIAYDALGNGQSDRPDDTAAYSLNNCVADALAVMDATEAGEAILVGLSFGGLLACCIAAYHPERAKAAILAGVAGVVGPTHSHMSPKHFLTPRETFEGWDKYNRAYWLADYPDFARHFISQHLHRAAFDQADRGRHRLGQRDQRPGAGEDRRGPRHHARRSTSPRRCTAASAAPCWRSTATTTRSSPTAAASSSPS